MKISDYAKQAKLELDNAEADYFEKQFKSTLQTIEEFNSLSTKGVKPTYSVTGTKNVTRKDQIDKSRILTQKEALSQAKRTHQGYFVVDAILNED